MIEFKCPQCGKMFSSAHKRKKYCSPECMKAAFSSRRKGKTVDCVVCGKRFYVGPAQLANSHRRYCSSRCAHHARLRGKEIECAFCGRRFWVSLSHIANGTACCSKACKQKLMARKKRDRTKTGTCLRCEKRFSYDPVGHYAQSRLYCSPKCKHAGGGIKVCEICGQGFPILASQRGVTRKRFCSNTCRFKGQTGSNAPRWKGGRTVHKPYSNVRILTDERLDSGGRRCRYEHRIFVAEYLGRSLEPNGEPIVHLDGNNTNNALANLYVFQNRSSFIRARAGTDPWPQCSNVDALRRHEQAACSGRGNYRKRKNDHEYLSAEPIA